MTTEAHITRQIQVDNSGLGVRLFRNNTGQAWQGRVVHNPDGTIKIFDPRPVQFGLCNGGSDLIGLKTVTILPEHVGTTVAVFVALDIKLPSNLKRPKEQVDFIAMVRRMGGRAGFVDSFYAADDILAGVHAPLPVF